MFSVSLGEIFLILVLALVILGPDQVPKVARTIGKVVGGIRRLTDEFKYTLEESIREDEVKRMRQDAERRKKEYEERKKRDGEGRPEPEAVPEPGATPYPEAEAAMKEEAEPEETKPGGAADD